MNKKIVIGGLLCLVGLGSVFGFALDLFGSTVDAPLKKISFTRGGDMQGSYHGLTVSALDDKNALVCYEDANWHNEAIRVKEYIVPKSLLTDIKTIFNENKLAKCAKAPKSQFMALDAATSSYNFYFEEKDIRFNSNQTLSSSTYAALKKISACVADSCQKGERLPGLVLEPNAEGNMPIKYVKVPNKLAIKVVGYKNKSIYIAIGNDTKEKKEISLSSKLIDSANPSVIVAEHITDETNTLYELSNDDYIWKLDKGLTPGKYSLILGGYTTEFEIKQNCEDKHLCFIKK